MNSKIKHKQVGLQVDSHAIASLQDLATAQSMNSTSNNEVRFEHIKCVTPMTYSQKLYQSHSLEIAEQFEQALEDNSLEKIKELLDKVLEIGEDS